MSDCSFVPGDRVMWTAGKAMLEGVVLSKTPYGGGWMVTVQLKQGWGVSVNCAMLRLAP